jgi:hypothetical protein
MSAGRRVVDDVRKGAEGSAQEKWKKGVKGLRHVEHDGGRYRRRRCTRRASNGGTASSCSAAVGHTAQRTRTLMSAGSGV